MTPLATLVLYAWIPVIFYLYVRYGSQRGLILSFLIATLFLPQGIITLPALGDYSKVTATCYGTLLASIIFDSGRLTSLRPSWVDLPMLIWCLCMIPSQITNNLSPISPTITQVFTWGIPYLLGRAYFSNLEGVKKLAIHIFYGGLVYIPFCLYESRFSPVLHQKVYGFSPRTDFLQSIRLGGYRPSVFMEHGLAVGMWMMAAAFVGFWLWKTKVIKKVGNFPATGFVILLMITFVLCRSTGAYNYMIQGIIIILIGVRFRTGVLLFLLILGVATYISMGATGSLYTNPYVVNFLENQGEQGDRSQSLAFRIENEEILSAKARLRPVFGWGASGNNHVADEWGKTITITDSLWIIAFGVNGAVGLISFTAIFLLPAWGFGWFRYPAKSWANPKVAPAASLSVVLALYMLDSSLNAFPNPIFVISSGALSSLIAKPPEKLTASRKIAPSLPKRSLVARR